MKKYYILGGLALVVFLLGLHLVLTDSATELTEPTEQSSGGYGGMGK